MKAGSLGLPSNWQLPLRVCVSEARPLNRAVFSVLVKQSRAISLLGLSSPFSSFYGGLRAALLFGCHSAFEPLWLHLVSGSASCQEVDLPLICCYSLHRTMPRVDGGSFSPGTPTSCVPSPPPSLSSLRPQSCSQLPPAHPEFSCHAGEGGDSEGGPRPALSGGTKASKLEMVQAGHALSRLRRERAPN